MPNPKLRIIPLGGVGEIGKNMIAIELGKAILVADCGLMFPDEEMLGVDLVIPDFSYLLENRQRVLGVVFTHGHEDHVGGLPYLLRELNLPLWGTRLTLGMIRAKLAEWRLPHRPKLHEVNPARLLRIGPFDIEFFRVCHSIPDGVGLILRTPAGTIVHSGDFKFDQSPIDGRLTELSKLTKVGNEGVLALLCDATNVEKPGYTPSERAVGESLQAIFREAKDRVLVATFASNIHRLQQVFEISAAHKRKVAVVGRSMIGTVEIASALGYLKVPEHTLIPVEQIRRHSPSQVTVLTTGSQGEPLSALTRMAIADHKQLAIHPGDTVIISATPIPGNEDLVFRTVNHLFKRGAHVIYNQSDGVHVSGHANQEEIKLLINLVKPRYLIPIHGEARHQAVMTELAGSLGHPPRQAFALEVGDILELSARTARVVGKVTSSAGVMIDGLGVGDVGEAVLRDRKHLSEDGIVIVVLAIDRQSGQVVAGPDVVSRGFVYVPDADDLLRQARDRVTRTLRSLDLEEITEWTTVKNQVRSSLNRFLYDRLKRRPMVLPIIMEV